MDLNWSCLGVMCRGHKVTEQVMVGTHGQLKNLYNKRTLKFQAVRIVVFDEADEMLKVSWLPGLALLCVRGAPRIWSMVDGTC